MIKKFILLLFTYYFEKQTIKAGKSIPINERHLVMLGCKCEDVVLLTVGEKMVYK
ncbi:hypothetical protein HZA55_00135 [Candidatus Poribacteria bacterium]|nr:hypothetical protein [Candidatus Poribacteria bacterium]